MSDIGFDVILLPEQRVAELAVGLSKQLAEPKEFTLHHHTTMPHMSVYMLQISEAGMAAVLEKLQALARVLAPIHGNASRLYIDRNGYVDVEYDKTPELADLQMQIVRALNPLRNGMRAKDAARMSEATGLERQNYETYGWKSIGELYRPHVTLTKYAVTPDLPPFSVNDFSGDFTAIGLVEMGDHGTAARLIERFELEG